MSGGGRAEVRAGKATTPVRSRLFAILTVALTLAGCPLMVNTSFNVRGEPIVATPEDAFRCFMATGHDALAIGNCFLS